MKPTNEAEKEAQLAASRKKLKITLLVVIIIAALWLAFAIWDSQTGGFGDPLPVKVNFDSIMQYIQGL